MRSSIADYQVIEPAHSGPAGVACYLCLAPDRLRLDGSVTVTELAIDASAWQQFADSLVRIAKVQSADMLALYEAGPDIDPNGAGVYLAAEATPGGSLARPSGVLDISSRAAAVAAAARAAHALHEAGLAHGSISAASILITTHGPVLRPPRLDDPQGIVTMVSDWRDLVTIDPAMVGGDAPSRAGDIWALGATLHTALTSKPLYPGIEHDEPVTAVQRMLFTRPEVDPALPRGVAGVVTRCIGPDPAARPETALEVAEMLSGAVEA